MAVSRQAGRAGPAAGSGGVSGSGDAALRRLPYGVVMATAGASMLAGHCGLQVAVVPLLLLAIVQALWVPVAGWWRRRAGFRTGGSRWRAIGPPGRYAGMHTVPLGLAVIAGGLASPGVDGVVPWATVLARVGLGLTWVSTLACAVRFLWSLAAGGWDVRRLDGAWFLVPAAWLGASIATDALAQAAAGQAAAALEALELTGALFGWVGYWMVVAAAAVRVGRCGLGEAPRAPWWIAMGCAGLAAAALGRVLQDHVLASPWSALLAAAMTVTEIFAIILCLPVLGGSIRFLLRRCRFRAAAAWPPTFSTAVFALGSLVTGQVLASPAIGMLGWGAACATLLFWAVTAAWNAAHACLHGFGSRRRPA